ncbi:homoserine dehydrogenase [Pyrobaculum aerophilum]|uniref:homoserine dehydrogenase n=1 Tax=Pyrobaculum aerophilum TaxID=13773 RepID=A0A371R7F3_9CREN|nr:homoserine dehydrogenase [Pyrobaculum aerophilum]RFA98335.1 homoserine dehydrogenase [Pyrobaculum aerophilum]RFB00441.1 homoserine dehydrogenase [Pyrobaculum aerophilum]
MILLFGFGGVGRTYAELLYQKTSLRLCAVFDSGGGVAKKECFSWGEVKELLKTARGSVSKSGLGKAVSPDEALDYCQVVVDVSPPNYETGEPSLSLYKKAAAKGLAVVTANKAPLALAFREVAYKRLFYKATVMAGTPLIDLLRGLEPQEVIKIRGILNGSTNYVLTRVYKDGVSFEAAVREAKEMGILEPDPRLDIEGVDPAAKLVIIANTLGHGVTLKDVERRPLQPVGPVTRYLAIADFTAGKAVVEPVRLPPDDQIHVDYTMNAVEIITDVNTILLKGKGAGRKETAYVLLNDTIKAVEA